jgi:hypothetical protein
MHVEEKRFGLGNGLPVYEYGQGQPRLLRRSRFTYLEAEMSGIQLRRKISPYCRKLIPRRNPALSPLSGLRVACAKRNKWEGPHRPRKEIKKTPPRRGRLQPAEPSFAERLDLLSRKDSRKKKAIVVSQFRQQPPFGASNASRMTLNPIIINLVIALRCNFGMQIQTTALHNHHGCVPAHHGRGPSQQFIPAVQRRNASRMVNPDDPHSASAG